MKLRLSLILVTLLTALGGAPAPADVGQAITLFPTEQEAQKHCPADVVVWVNLPTGVYHFRGQRWYGNTKSGAFVCKAEADKAGDRPTKNGQ